VGGRPHRIYTNKEDTSSPTASIEAMMLSCAKDTKENKYVVVSAIPGAFLNADMEDNVHMLLEGTVAEMIIKLEPTIYRKHIWYNKHGEAMLYVPLKKHYTGRYRQHCCSGSYCQRNCMSGDLH